MKRVALVLISVVYGGISAVYRSCANLVGLQLSDGTVVLTYHNVSAQDLAGFESQMRALRARATPVFADDNSARNGRPRVAVTFDDAFQSVFDCALPILAKYHIPATIFVPTAYLGGPPGWSVTPGTPNPPSGAVAGVATLAAIDPRLVKLGSHTMTHPRLAAVAATQVDDELVGSRRVLEQLTGEPIRLLALPYGSFSDDVLLSANRAGYKAVFANVPVRRTRRAGIPLVGRVNTSPRDSVVEFRLKAAGAYNWLAAAIPVKRAVFRVLKRRGI